jgi:membrane protein
LRRFRAAWQANGLTDSAAALAFYGLISLVPLLLLGVELAGLVLGPRAARGELQCHLDEMMGHDSAVFIEQVLHGASLGQRGSPIATVLVVLVLGYSGSHVLHKLRSTLNVINAVGPGDRARPIIRRLLARGLSGLFILGFGLLLTFGTVAKGFVTRFAQSFHPEFLAGWQLVRVYDRISTVLLLVLAFTFILKVLPRRRPPWRFAVAGALPAAIAVCLLKGGLDFYLSHSLFASVFGTSLAVLVFLLWFFLSIEVFLAGAQFTALLGNWRGARPEQAAASDA